MSDLIIDRDFAELLAVFPPLQFADPVAQRAAFREQTAGIEPPPWPDEVGRERRELGGVPVRVYRRRDRTGTPPVLVWIHGGGYCLGTPDEDEPFCGLLARDIGAVVVSVDYRLAPEHPFPAGLDDCCAVLRAVAAEYPDSRVAVAGASAGAGLAAATTLRARAGACPVPNAQLLLMPFLDARMSGESMRALADAPVFNAGDAADCWAHYLGDRLADPPPDASPSSVADLSGLPPAWVLAAGSDCLRDEAIHYALRLQSAGVRTELHVVPGVPHGFTGLVPGAAASRRAVAELVAVATTLLEEDL